MNQNKNYLTRNMCCASWVSHILAYILSFDVIPVKSFLEIKPSMVLEMRSKE